MSGLFSRKPKHDEASYQFQEVGCHGDRYLRALMDKLVTRVRIECFSQSWLRFAFTAPHRPDADKQELPLLGERVGGEGGRTLRLHTLTPVQEGKRHPKKSLPIMLTSTGCSA